MADTFELETSEGVRKLEFDPDALWQRDVRILVDGGPVATMPWPNDASPHQEIAVSVDERALVGMAQLANEGGPVDSWGLRFDLFSNGLSLSDGSTLETARLGVLTPRYPGVFRFIDGVLRIAPAAAIPGILIGVNRRADDPGQGTATTIVLLAALIGAMLVGTALGSWVWGRIRARTELGVPIRAALGGAAILASYAVAWGAAIAVIVGLMNTGFIFQSVCGDAGTAAAAGGSGEGQPSGMVLLDEPGPDFTLVWEGPMTLEQSAASRVDTETLPQLRAAGFDSAYRREWIRDDGTTLGTDIFVFATAEGATSYHIAVTDYACRYSSESFAVPGGGVGLRILYGSGDPVRDQVAWIDGNRRVVIAIGYRDDSGDHREVLDFVDRARSSTPLNSPQ